MKKQINLQEENDEPTSESLAKFNDDILRKYEAGKISFLEYYNARMYCLLQINPNAIKLMLNHPLCQ